jgi:hypothetical protein
VPFFPDFLASEFLDFGDVSLHNLQKALRGKRSVFGPEISSFAGLSASLHPLRRSRRRVCAGFFKSVPSNPAIFLRPLRRAVAEPAEAHRRYAALKNFKPARSFRLNTRGGLVEGYATSAFVLTAYPVGGYRH